MKKYKSLLDAIGLKQLLDGTSFPRFNETNAHVHIHAQYSQLSSGRAELPWNMVCPFFVSFQLKSMILISMQLGLYTH